jgi:hypothetical protein
MALRPEGKTGPIGQMAMGVTRPGITGIASIDGRVPAQQSAAR